MAGTCLTQVLTGEIIKGVTCVWTNIPNMGHWFYPIMILGLQTAIYGKTQNILTTLTIGLILSSFMVAEGFYTGVEAAMTLPIIMLGLNLGGILAKVVLKM